MHVVEDLAHRGAVADDAEVAWDVVLGELDFALFFAPLDCGAVADSSGEFGC